MVIEFGKLQEHASPGECEVQAMLRNHVNSNYLHELLAYQIMYHYCLADADVR